MVEEKWDTNLPTQEERIRVRRERILARSASEDPDKAANGRGGAETKEEAVKSKGQQAVADSLATLDRKKYDGIDRVTMIRVTTDWRETQRRVSEEKAKESRLQRLQEEAVRSGKANAAVEMRWGELLDQNMPQELYNEIEAQKSACAEIIASKDSVLREFQRQLKGKDEEYVKSLKEQAEDIQELLKRMRGEFKDLQESYEAELESVEDTYLTERDELLQQNRKEIDDLFEKRRESELMYMEKKNDREEQYQKEIEDLLAKDSEEYSKLKIKLETDIQTLEQQLEEMRATYQLNTEKLEYNYRVLTERDNENSTTLNSLKRKQNKLKDMLSAIVQKYHETDAKDRKRNDELTEEYRRITKQYRDLQAKFRHFEVSDKEKYDAVFNMHEEDVNDLVAKVLKADEIIHKQQLGWDWKAPDLDDLKTNGTCPKLKETASNEEIAIPGHKLRAMIELLCFEAGFLIEPKVKEALAKLKPEEAEVAQAESLLRALGVKDDRDVASLMDHFFIAEAKKNHKNKTDDDDEDEEDDDDEDTTTQQPEALRQLQTIISADDVIKAITAFVQGRQSMAGVTSAAATSPTRLRAANDASKRQQQQERDFWARQADVISSKTFRVWKQLEIHLQKYNAVLNQRANEISKVTSLQEQNAALKNLLTQYLGAKVNDELIVPPSQTIRMPNS